MGPEGHLTGPALATITATPLAPISQKKQLRFSCASDDGYRAFSLLTTRALLYSEPSVAERAKLAFAFDDQRQTSRPSGPGDPVMALPHSHRLCTAFQRTGAPRSRTHVTARRFLTAEYQQEHCSSLPGPSTDRTVLQPSLAPKRQCLTSHGLQFSKQDLFASPSSSQSTIKVRYFLAKISCVRPEYQLMGS